MNSDLLFKILKWAFFVLVFILVVFIGSLIYLTHLNNSKSISNLSVDIPIPSYNNSSVSEIRESLENLTGVDNQPKDNFSLSDKVTTFQNLTPPSPNLSGTPPVFSNSAPPILPNLSGEIPVFSTTIPDNVPR